MNKSPQYNQQSNCPHSVHILDFLKKKKKFSENPVNLDMGIYF